MDCVHCSENYLKEIFQRCEDESSSSKEALSKFDNICVSCHDPRTPIAISKAMVDYDCADCKRFKELYKDHIKQ